MNDRPIGVFDSGLGGLTVLKEIIGLLPGESVVYFGDCGRAPYGIKSPETIRRYTFQNTRFFIETGVKLLVIACNTSSAHAYGPVSAALDFPVVEVIRPGSAAAVRATKNKKIGVIGTAATITSRVYERVIAEMDPSIEVYSKACPLFVPIAEEGPDWWAHEAARIIAGEYLADLRETGIDCLVLGCTHYPLLEEVIRGAAGGGITLISSARAVAAEVRCALDSRGLRAAAEPVKNTGPVESTGPVKNTGPADNAAPPKVSLYTSDSPERFRTLCGSILGATDGADVYTLDIEKYESRLP